MSTDWSVESDFVPYQAVETLGACHLLVLAPHPDDEVLGCGGLIARSLASGCAVTVRISAIVDACFRLIVDGVSGHRGRAGVARKRGVQCISVVYDQFEARRGRAAVDAPVGRVLGLWI
jgi:hypothetical protein